MTVPRLVPVVVLAALLLTGCGGSPEAEPTSPETTPVPNSPTTTVASPTTPPATKPPATKPPAPTPTASPTAAPPPAHDGPPRGAQDLSGSSYPQFVNKTGDTTCLFEDFEGVHVRCDVMGARWGVKKPAECPSAYGDAVTLASVARLVCHGDTIFSPDVTLTLKPGQSAKFKGLWCTVTTRAVACQNGQGHGFSVSPGAYSIR